MVVDVPGEHAVPWMAPMDVEADMLTGLADEKELQHQGGLMTAMADCSVAFPSARQSPSDWESLSTINGGEPAPEL